MALVNVVNMVVLDNPCNFANPFQFEITFECLQELEEDLEWKVIYVGSAHDTTQDQVLDEILVGPVPVGVNKFVLQADAPNPAQLPPNEVLGVTVVLVTCSYREREFVRVGYYVNNELPGLAADQAPPSFPTLDMAQVERTILADKPRVTKFPIQWGTPDAPMMANDENNQAAQQPTQPAAALPLMGDPQDPLEQKMAQAMAGPSHAAASAATMETD